jgi:fluoroquinolone resistance protein
MGEVFIENKTYDRVDYTEIGFMKGEYENCTFSNCDFSKGSFAYSRFIDCTFLGCNLSLVHLTETIFRDTRFNNSKMLGLLFQDCNKPGLSFAFEHCILNHSSFYRTTIKKTLFKNCQLQETDWTDCDLTACNFEHCDLKDAKFENTNLEKVDFRTAFNYSFDPASNRIRKAKFSIMGVPGLLKKYDIEIDD